MNYLVGEILECFNEHHQLPEIMNDYKYVASFLFPPQRHRSVDFRLTLCRHLRAIGKWYYFTYDIVLCASIPLHVIR